MLSCVLTSISQYALMYMHRPLRYYCSKRARKLTYKTRRINSISTTQPTLFFCLRGKSIKFATFSQIVLITSVNKTKHHFHGHRKFMKH